MGSQRQIRGDQRIAKTKNMRSANRKILIVTEGEKTEPQYFEGLADLLNAQAVKVIAVRPVGLGKDPLSVVREAERRAKAERAGGDPYDEIWCVVDVDEHASLPTACAEAKRKKLQLAVSSPAFEIWLVWHHENWTAWSTNSELTARLKRNWGFADKNLPPKFPFENYKDAQRRARRCEQIVKPYDPPNPSSSVVELVDQLEKACMVKQPKTGPKASPDNRTARNGRGSR